MPGTPTLPPLYFLQETRIRYYEGKIITNLFLRVVTGYAKEFDKPSRLIEKPSLFGALVQEYANRSSGL